MPNRKQGNRRPRNITRAQRAKQMRIRRIITSVVVVLVLVLLIVLIAKSCGKTSTDKDNNNAAKPNATTSASETDNIGPNDVAKKASIVNTGDILIHELLLDNSKSGDDYAFDKHFEKITPIIKKVDYAVANFEITLGGKKEGKPKNGYTCFPMFNSPDSVGTALKNAGFDLLLTSNNHCYDTGFNGVKRTVDTLRGMGIKTTGTRSDLSQKKYEVVDINGIKVGMVNYTYETQSNSGGKAMNGIEMVKEAIPYVNSFNEQKLDVFYSEMEENIKNMKKDGAEAIVLYMHWGTEYQFEPTGTQKKIAQKMADMGVDALIGGHPHVLQGSEVIKSDVSGKDMFCIYSVGNALSNQRREYMGRYGTGHTEDGILVYLNFVKYGDGRVELKSVDYTPTWVNRYEKNGSFTYEITALDKMDDIKINKAEAQKSKARTDKIVKSGFDKYNALKK